MFNTLNIQKITAMIVLRGRGIHNARTHTGKIPSNIDQDRTKGNKHIGDAYQGVKDIWKEVQAERVDAGANKMRKNAVPAVEVVMGASAEFWDSATQEDKNNWYKDSRDWLAQNFEGRGEVVSMSLHKDERYPHWHFIYAPVVTKLDKKTGKDLRTFDAKGFVGNQMQMRLDRDSQTRFMTSRGYDMKRGTDYFKEGKEPPKNHTVKELKKLTIDAEKTLREIQVQTEEARSAAEQNNTTNNKLIDVIDHNTKVIQQQDEVIEHNNNIIPRIQERISQLWIQLQQWGTTIEPFGNDIEAKLKNATPEEKKQGEEIYKEYQEAEKEIDRRIKPRI
jgi:hypothetical protein